MKKTEKREVTKKYRISGDEYMRLQMSLFFHRTWHWFFMAFGMFVMLCFFHLQVALAVVMVASVLFPLLVLRYYWLNITQPRHKRYFYDTQISLCDDGIVQEFDDASVQLYEWHTIIAMRCRSHYSLIFSSTCPFLYIPADAFLSMEVREEFELLIRALKYRGSEFTTSK